MAPKVSVCIPVYNGEAFVRAALDSVLDQDVDGLEVVVYDNASTDGTVEVVREVADDRVRVLRHDRNVGATANWNAVVAEAEGTHVKLLCADDILYPGALARQIAALDSSNDVVMVASRRDIVDERGRVLLAARGLNGLRGTVDGMIAVRAVVRAGTNSFGEPVCVLMCREAMERVGGFDGRRPYVIDLDFWCRLAAIGAVHADPEPAGAFRVNLGSWSRELSFHQAVQASSLLREIRGRHPEAVRPIDLGLGVSKAWALSAARILTYAWLARDARP